MERKRSKVSLLLQYHKFKIKGLNGLPFQPPFSYDRYENMAKELSMAKRRLKKENWDWFMHHIYVFQYPHPKFFAIHLHPH